jgi:integral membrane protein
MRTADIPRIRTALILFRISAGITGTMLLLLVLMMIFRYGLGVDIELGGPAGFLALTPRDMLVGTNLSIIILTVHGWLYVVYLAIDFALWRFGRWSFLRFVFIALGGIIPLLSFFLERIVPGYVRDAIEGAK